MPTLEDFEKKISVYQSAFNAINAMPDEAAIGWLCVDLRPVKQVPKSFLNSGLELEGSSVAFFNSLQIYIVYNIVYIVYMTKIKYLYIFRSC